MSKLVNRIYSVNSLMKNKKTLGDMPTTKLAYKNAINIAWPSAAEAVLVGLVSSIDTMMVGSIKPDNVGTAAIAAVGVTNQPKFILLAIIFSLNVGVTAIVARRKGEQDREGANRSLRQSLMLCASISFVLSILGFVFARDMLLLVGAQSDVIDMATVYFKIIVIGNFFTSLSLNINAAQRGAGNTKISMRTNIVANLINLTFNYLLINGKFGLPKLGVTGAAIATLLGNLVAFGMSVRSISKPDGFLYLKIRDKWKFDKKTVGGIFGISSSSLAEQLCMRIGFLVTTMLVTSLGTVAFATHQICMNIVNLSFTFGDGLGMGASAMVGQNLGAKRPDLSSLYSKVIQRIALTIGLILFLFFMISRYFLVDLFTNDMSIIKMGGLILIIVAFMSPIQTVAVVIGGSLRGAGDTKFVAYSSLISIGVIRPFTTWLFCYPLHMGIFGAWIAFMTDQLVRFFINSWRFKTGKWTEIKI